MDPLDKGHTMSANLASEQISATNNQPAQVDMVPRFHNPLPINWALQPWSSAELNVAQAQTQVTMPTNQGSYQLLSMNNQSMQNDPNKRSQISMPMLLTLGQLSSANRHLGPQPPPWVQAPMFMNIASQPTTSANKQPMQIRPSSKLQNVMTGSTGSQPSPSTNKRPAQPGTQQKVQSESFESVRQKLRNSLAAALAMDSEKQNVQASEKSPRGEASGMTNEIEVANSVGVSSSAAGNASSGTISSESSQKRDEAQSTISNVLKNDSTTSTIACDVQELQPKDVSMIDEVPADSSVVKDELLQGHGLCWVADVDNETVETMTKHEVKRLKVAHDTVETTTKHEVKRLKVAHDEVISEKKDTTEQDLEKLAYRIEAELFKLFGGVNKKYKEKGRSLLFNLKDRNNPELRERVLSGDIAPERLCSLTVEELASKELSQWRLAKAEELAQMVVLVDSEIDVRRLVKKTHKGEFQVEMEQVDSVSMEVELGRNVIPQLPLKANEEVGAQSKSSRKIKDDNMSDTGNLADKFDSNEENISSNLDNLLQEKSDLMQELMEDEIKDPELLPPIVSLDEFMQALDSEPPFENLPVNPLQESHSSETENNDNLEPKTVTLESFEPLAGSASNSMGRKLDSSKVRSEPKLQSSVEDGDSKSKLGSSIGGANNKLAPPDTPLGDHLDNLDVKPSRTDDDSTSRSIQVQTEPSEVVSTGNNLWEGLVQLNISALATVVGVFKSGERTSTKEWPSFLEVKGRVRLDAFEKFLQELPLSRSRAIMIAQFVWKEGTPESGRVNLQEIIDSYIADNRLGFLEPVTGVELYLCPPHSRITELLTRCLPKEQAETLDTIADGLIGVVVWRRPHTTISPRMPSHHKHGNMKKHCSSRKQPSIKSNFSRRTSMLPSPTHPPINAMHSTDDDDIDDVPPGFGPRDDDDLPEFDYVLSRSQSSKPVSTRPSVLPPPNRPVDEIRQLIHKYGQTENSKKRSIDAQPWNDDDDDDIPEWQPQQNLPPPSQPHSHPHPQATAPPPPQPQILPYNQQQNQQPFQANHPMLPLPLQPQALQQQIMPLAASMPMPLQLPLQSQMGMLQAPLNMLPGWQPNPWLPIPGGSMDMSMPAVGLMPPSSQYSGQPFNVSGQVYGLPNLGGHPNNGMGWRPDVPRSRAT